jgi:hypothetical protein
MRYALVEMKQAKPAKTKIEVICSACRNEAFSVLGCGVSCLLMSGEM